MCLLAQTVPMPVSSDLSAPFVKSPNAGEPFDVMITGSASLDGLIKDGKIIAGAIKSKVTRPATARSTTRSPLPMS